MRESGRVAQLIEDRQVAAQQLREAVLTRPDEDIVEVARRARELGAEAPEWIWELVYECERRHQLVGEFRRALASLDDAKMAQLWSTLDGNWPDALQPLEYEEGRAAFLRHGRKLREQRRRGRSL